ncbi:MAG: TadE/TadG family type IV pilus assembly protein [Pseudomonadota bacterium]
MKIWNTALRRALRRFKRDDRGSSSVEFVVVFPLLFFVIAAIFEVGVLATRTVLLERALDVAARDLRLGNDPFVSHDTFKTTVCGHAPLLFSCDNDLVIELRELNVADAYPQNQANCQDSAGAVDPTITFSAGGRNRIMFIRACLVVRPIFPGIGVGLQMPKDAGGGYQIVSYTAFMNEPA